MFYLSYHTVFFVFLRVEDFLFVAIFYSAFQDLANFDLAQSLFL